MIWRLGIAAIVIAAAFYGLHAFQGFKEEMIAQAVAKQLSAGSITISAEPAKAEEWQDFLVSVGSLQSVQGTDLAPEVSGVVTAVNFTSGQEVTKGTLLVEINDSVEEAALKGQQATAVVARKQFERYQTLAKRGDQSQASLDEQRAAWQQAVSAVEQTEATIGLKNIRAPFDGKLGIRQVNLGQFVSPGQVLVTLQDIDHLYVNFSLPAQHIAKLKVGLDLEVTTDAYPGEVFKAKLTALDAAVNQSTRNIQLQGTMDNPGRKLLPGMFVNVKVLLPDMHDVVTVPETAISYSLFGDSVYVVMPYSQFEAEAKAQAQAQASQSGDSVSGDGGDGAGQAGPALDPNQQVVKQVFVQVGSRREGRVAIQQGLKAGDVVVTSGQTKLRNGTPVGINNTVSLTPRNPLPRG